MLNASSPPACFLQIHQPSERRRTDVAATGEAEIDRIGLARSLALEKGCPSPPTSVNGPPRLDCAAVGPAGALRRRNMAAVAAIATATIAHSSRRSRRSLDWGAISWFTFSGSCGSFRGSARRRRLGQPSGTALAALRSMEGGGFQQLRTRTSAAPAGGVRTRTTIVRDRTFRGGWRPEPELNRRARICSPLRNHSAIGPGRAGSLQRRSPFGQPRGRGRSSFDEWRLARPEGADRSSSLNSNCVIGI